MSEEEVVTTEENENQEEVEDEALRPEGVKALGIWKQRAKEAEKEAKRVKELESKLQEFEEANKTEQERLIEQARKEASEQTRNELMSEIQRERLETNVLKAAVGKLNDPDDAIKFLDLGEIETEEEITSAIDELIENKPYLAASAMRPAGSADQGVRKQANTVKQLSREDLASMTAEQINKARTDGQLDEIMGRR